MERKLLILVTLNDDHTDGVGNVYPKDGFVRADNFKPDKDIRSGLFGIPWGRTGSGQYLKHGPDDIWAVIKISQDDWLVILDEDANIVKFEKGLVVCVGSASETSSYIAEEVGRNKEFCVTEIAGFINNAGVPNCSALARGYGGRAVSEIATLHAIGLAHKTQACTTQMESCAIALGKGSTAAVLDDMSIAVAAGSESCARSLGDGSHAIALTPFSRAFSMGCGGIAMCLEPGCVASTGLNGVLIMAYKDGADRIRFAIGYVGDGIEPNLMYECENGKFVLVD